ncbi:Crp/Fnr family transcriptional regulator [Rhodoferax sediminis]|uniref:Crp/Fnr family transcriptional regulator n=1 Tax=Rhodoferax sediminis TaxID=2509614 RepID=A0A515DDK2_9BURK|nr:Crp/Fnr family transcriptional regulator [Rhodoferax sediminis]QDL38465.1 Crp/Fnr family transcriptional regulator [Rhodoferax sediminis]
MPKTVRPTYRPLARALLGRDPWFSHFDGATLDRFVKEGDLRQLASGEVLCRRGEAIGSLCVVIEGVLDVSHSAESGKRHVWSYLGPGQVMNLIPILDDQLSIHDVCAHGDSTLLLIPKESFLAAVTGQPDIARLLLRLLCLRSRVLYEHAADNALLSLRARCARMLLSLMAVHGLPRPSGVAISLKLSQDEFADMLGRTRQSVNRELKQLERENIISMSYSHFVVRDEQALSAIVGE